ncbi:MAG: hypothetical protein JRF15_08810 [Deltaproteobacteria bacterium]|jgi:hypothetical protein|nr:hypothetical protein [Deltaproteobacteria bacterium]
MNVEICSNIVVIAISLIVGIRLLKQGASRGALPELGGTLTAYIWCSVEGAMYYANMRKRARHGLADPIVTNRVLLWSCYAISGAITELLYMTGVAVGGSGGSYPFIFDAIMIVTTTAGALLILLAFFPPPAYLRWVASDEAAASDTPKTATAK